MKVTSSIIKVTSSIIKVRSSIIKVRSSIVKVRSSIITVGWECEWQANLNLLGGYKANHSFIIKEKITNMTLTRNCYSWIDFAARIKVTNGNDNSSGMRGDGEEEPSGGSGEGTG